MCVMKNLLFYKRLPFKTLLMSQQKLQTSATRKLCEYFNQIKVLYNYII